MHKPLRTKNTHLVLLALSLSLVGLFCRPAAALANSGTLTWSGGTETFSDVSSLMSKAESVGGDVTISLSDDWFIKDARLVIPEGRAYTLKLNGHMINREKAGSFGSDDPWRGEGECQVIYIKKNASLTIEGGDQTTEHPGTLSNSYGYSGQTDYFFWSYDANGKDVIKGGLITGGACDDSDGAGGISLAGDGASLTMRDVTVAGNIADSYSFVTSYYGYGGGISLQGNNNTLAMSNSKVMYNHAADSAGGIYVYGDNCNVTINDSEVSNNLSVNEIGNLTFVYGGGGMLLRGKSCKLSASNSKFNSNMAYKRRPGGGIRVTGNYADCTFKNCEFAHNVSCNGSGGAVSSDSDCATFSFESCKFQSNKANMGGGAVKLSDASSVSFTKGTKFSGNATETYEGGAVSLYYNNKEEGHTATFSDCTIESNAAKEGCGGGISVKMTANAKAMNLELSDGTTIFKKLCRRERRRNICGIPLWRQYHSVVQGQDRNDHTQCRR